MIKLKEIQANGLYIFLGKASANSSFIESKVEAKDFIESANRRFANFLKIREFLVTQDSWLMVCEVEDELTILREYLKRRMNSNRKYKKPSLTEVWRIVSEQFRHFLSRFVKFCNLRRGRTGSLVHSNYERYFFEDEEEALLFIKDIWAQSITPSQNNEKYRPRTKHFGFSKKERKGHIYLCSLKLMELVGGFLEGVKSIVMWDLSTNVLRIAIQFTLNLHQSYKTIKLSPKKE